MDDYEFYKILVELDLQQRKLIKTERYIDELHIIIDKIKNKLETFASVRDWNKFHNPKNLSMSLASEAGETIIW